MNKKFIAYPIIIIILFSAGCGKMLKKNPERGAVPPDLSKLVEMKAVDAAYNQESHNYLFHLEAAEEKMAGIVLPIYVGEREASVLSMKLNRQSTPRPLTHDLLLNMVNALGGQIKHVVVEELRDNVYLARIYMTDKNGILHSVDSRASDAIILGVATGTKLHFSKEVVRKGAAAPAPKAAPAGGWNL